MYEQRKNTPKKMSTLSTHLIRKSSKRLNINRLERSTFSTPLRYSL